MVLLNIAGCNNQIDKSFRVQKSPGRYLWRNSGFECITCCFPTPGASEGASGRGAGASYNKVQNLAWLINGIQTLYPAHSSAAKYCRKKCRRLWLNIKKSAGGRQAATVFKPSQASSREEGMLLSMVGAVGAVPQLQPSALGGTTPDTKPWV